jgi:hypothetical protein
MGRTTLLHKALRHADERHTVIVHMGRSSGRPPSVEAVTAEADGRRLVIVVDDAHLVDAQTMLVVRELHRRTGALLLITQPTRVPGTGRPDPLDCLRHEPGLRTLRLEPLRRDEIGALTAEVLGGPVRPATVAALHAATGGNPGLLHDLLVGSGLAELLERSAGRWQLRRVPAELSIPPSPEALDRLRDAAREAWRNLELDAADELCRLASWSGLAAEVAPMWAALLLFCGRAEEGLAVLDTHPSAPSMPRAVMVRALLLALGRGEVTQASEALAGAAPTAGAAAGCLLAKRAWLLAITGRCREAEEALRGLEPHADREAYVYTLAARASVALAAGEPNVAVAALRRALLGAKAWQHEVPWLAPYLTANLIDALLLAGRINEATTAAADFHAGAHGCGWRIAVTIADLTATAAGAPVEPAC